MPCAFALPRSAGQKPDNAAIRDKIRENTPLVMFGSINERMYLAEIGGTSIFPRLSPAPSSDAIRARPSWAMPGRRTSFRRSATRLFDALFTCCLWRQPRRGFPDAGSGN